MAISQPLENIYNKAFASTAELISDTYYPHPNAQGITLWISCDKNGTAAVDILLSDGTWNAYDTGNAVVGGTLLEIPYDHKLPALRVRFTPGAQPGTLVIDAAYHGYAGNIA